MSNQLTTVNDRIIIRPSKELAEKISKKEDDTSVIVTLDNEEPKALAGEVLAVGPGTITGAQTMRYPLQCKVGDIVIFGAYAGNTIVVHGETLRVCVEQEILAIYHQSDEDKLDRLLEAECNE